MPKNYCMITEGRFVKTWLPIHLKRASPYVDRFVLVDDGTFPDDAKDYLKQFTDKEIVILTRKWDNCHVCQRNVYIDYLKKEKGIQWCIVMDSDEFPSKQLLEFYSKLDENAMISYASPSHDIRIPYKVKVDPIFTYFFGGEYIEENVSGGETSPEEVNEIAKELGLTQFAFFKQFGFRKVNIFPITPTTKYVGTVHEALDGIPNVTNVDYPYYHVKALWEIHRDGFRNYVEGGGGVNLGDKNPHYVEMKKMLPDTNWHEVRSLKDITPLLLWMYMNAGDTGHEWSSETYDVYMYLQYATRSVLPFKYEKTWLFECPPYYEIKVLYNSILHREPDEAALASYCEEWYKQTLSQLINGMLNSEEFKDKFGKLF